MGEYPFEGVGDWWKNQACRGHVRRADPLLSLSVRLERAGISDDAPLRFCTTQQGTLDVVTEYSILRKLFVGIHPDALPAAQVLSITPLSWVETSLSSVILTMPQDTVVLHDADAPVLPAVVPRMGPESVAEIALHHWKSLIDAGIAEMNRPVKAARMKVDRDRLFARAPVSASKKDI